MRPYTPTRHPAITEKVTKEATGLKAALYTHVEFDEHGELYAVRFSEPKKEDSSLERILNALGDSVTGIIRQAREARE